MPRFSRLASATSSCRTARSSSTPRRLMSARRRWPEAVVLTELRSGGAGLEEMFLELTADDAREEVSS